MTEGNLLGLVVTFILGAFVLAGAAVASFARDGGRIRDISISVALGAMAALLIVDLIPEALENAGEVGWPFTVVGVVAGVVVLVTLDRFLPEGHHDFGDEDRCGEHGHAGSALHISIATTIALVAHNIVEGISVYSLASQSLAMALALGIGVGLHNVPMGMVVASGLRHESIRRKTIVLGFAALSTFFGGLVMFALSSAVDQRIVSLMIDLTIGLLLYIIAFELVPHVLHTRRRGLAAASIVLGVLAVAASGLLEGLA